jgi:serine/threonine-protein kinase
VPACPPLELLQQFLTGKLAPAEAASLAGHVDDCADCQGALERLCAPAEKGVLLSAKVASLAPAEARLLDQLAARTLPPSPDKTARVGALAVPGYEVLELLGRGGMGVVHKARQLGLDRLVALKMIRAGEQAGPAHLHRFRAEAAAVARLTHPNIVQIYEIGEVSGEPFFSMELVEGGSLQQKLAGTPLPGRDAAGLVEALARAVHYAHQQGVLHRDLKPANVLLAGEGSAKPQAEEGERPTAAACGLALPKITDFGLAKRLDVDSGHTQTGDVMGTPSYMAPEQAAGRKDVGPAADVYALGAILYECLTGRPPFRAATVMDTLWQVMHDDPVSPRRLVRALPRDLETVCLKCLDKEPARRYRTAADLAEDLRRFRAGEPVRARPASAFRRGWRFTRRHSWQVALGLVLLLASGAGLAFLAWRAREHDRVARLVNEKLGQADDLQRRGRTPEALAVVAQLADALGDAPRPERDRVERRRRELQLVRDLEEHVQEIHGGYAPLTPERTRRAREGLFRDFGIDLESGEAEEVAGRIRETSVAQELATILDLWAYNEFGANGSPDRALRLLAVSRLADPDEARGRLRDWLVGRDRAALARLAESLRVEGLPPRSLLLLALAHRAAGQDEAGLALLRRARHLHPDSYLINDELGSAHALVRPPRHDEAIRYWTAALSLRPDSAHVAHNLAVSLLETGRTEEAFVLLEQARERSPGAAGLLALLGRAHFHQGRLREAEACLRDALARDGQHTGAWLQLGNVHNSRGQIEESALCYAKVLKLDRDHAGAHHNLGRLLALKGVTAKAVHHLRRAVELRPELASAHLDLASVLQKGNRPAEAVAAYRRFLDLRTDRDPQAALVHVNVAAALDSTGDMRGAVAHSRRALALRPNLPQAHNNLGNTLRRLGQPDEAINSLRQAIALRPDYANAHCNLGLALFDAGRFVEALVVYRRGDELGRKLPGWNYSSPKWMQQCERVAALDARLPEVLARPATRDDAVVRLQLARLCLRYKRLHATAARLFEEALAARPELAGAPPGGNRADAARAAVRAGWGEGADRFLLDAAGRERRRDQALAWLTQDLRYWAAQRRAGGEKGRQAAARVARQWLSDPHLAAAREEARLARVPPDERKRWQALWAEVKALQGAAGGPVAVEVARPGPPRAF